MIRSVLILSTLAHLAFAPLGVAQNDEACEAKARTHLAASIKSALEEIACDGDSSVVQFVTKANGVFIYGHTFTCNGYPHQGIGYAEPNESCDEFSTDFSLFVF